MTVTRRTLLTSAALLALLPAACTAPGTGGAPLAQLVSAVDALAIGLTNLKTVLAPLNPSATVLSILDAALAGAEAAGTALASVASAPAAQPIVQQLVALLEPVLGAVAAVPGIPSAVTVALAAVATLIPFMQSLVGLATAKATARAAMTPERAMQVLRTLR